MRTHRRKDVENPWGDVDVVVCIVIAKAARNLASVVHRFGAEYDGVEYNSAWLSSDRASVFQRSAARNVGTARTCGSHR
jgi:hypothetical protein